MSIYDKLYNQVKEIEARLHRTEAAAAQAANTPVDRRIPGGTGAVTVSGTGTLISVTIDPHNLTSTNGRALGAQIAQTIRDAESQARTQRQHILQSASATGGSAHRGNA
ncbi:YbaB/EbfC family nucleoid-associated protein [Amycolatopsis benzoatilytica]|uniref:YbaB/EbfC family nucleoid-associated protein n=1 Tax=Amycolatopsis benzoatilytica TaxID=346045 RepID=UPI00036CC2A3|nr:YbaB/EbfC family nucleoid-associated protein [Amycolatopsis benzoatilytica]